MRCLTFICIFHLLLLGSDAADKQPNIVLIIADDLGHNDVGYHNPDMITPNIDKLSNSGVKLENYYVQPICTPTRSQLLTGRYQIRTGLQHSVLFAVQPHCLPLDEVTLPQKLKEAGYSTHMVGKWHLGMYRKECLPTHRGFDSYFGYYCGAEDYYTKKQAGHCAVTGKTFMGYDLHENDEPYYDNHTYSTHLYRDRAVQLINNYTSEKPMFLYLPFQSVHFPLQAPDEYLKLYPNVTNKKRKYFSAMVTAMDEAIGHVVKSLQDKGMWDNTILIFSTDNGGQTLWGGNNFPLRGRKASLWEGGIKAVGFVHGVGVDGNGRVSRELMHVSDWMPTLLHVAGAKLNGTKPLDGVNNWSVLSSSESKSNRKEILHNIDPGFTRPYDPQPSLLPYPNKHGVNTTTGHSAIRVGRWKLFTGDPGHDEITPVPTSFETTNEISLNGTKQQQQQQFFEGLLRSFNFNFIDTKQPSVRLYDIEADPSESYNVADYFPQVVDDLLSKIAAYNHTAVPISFPPCDPMADPALRNGVWGPWVV